MAANEGAKSAEPILEVRLLSVARGGERVIDGLTLALPRGESLAIAGESGCGKSTLLQALAGLLPAASGEVSRRYARSAFVWQDLGLVPWKRVIDNMLLPLEVGPGRRDCPSRAQARSRAEAILAELGLAEFARRWPAELSGGQRQRLAIGRALVARPEVLFMDEPFSALDALRREKLQDDIAALAAERGASLVFVTHDIGEAVFLAQKILLLAAHPFRVLGLVENSACALRSNGDYAALRESDAFGEAVRAIHQTLRRAARSGEAA